MENKITHLRRIFICLIFTLIFINVHSQSFNLGSTKLKVGDKFVAEKVFFDVAKESLRPESYPLLDSIASFMLVNDSLIIEVGFHFHYNPPSYLSGLGQRRAQTIVNYLIKKGVSKKRLEARDYGDSQPIIPQIKIDKMETEEEKEKARKVNRRIELKIKAINR